MIIMQGQSLRGANQLGNPQIGPGQYSRSCLQPLPRGGLSCSSSRGKLAGASSERVSLTIIRTKSLDYTYKSITFGTFGAFGSGTWDVIERACDPRTHPDATGDYDPWRRPAPKRDFILSLGFALQRANVRMLRGSSLRRRRNRAKDCFASGSRSQ